jgi:hypothetical protein
MTDKIFQVKITLVDSNPGIWRRLLIPSDLRLSVFHKVIQVAFGWTNSHLHQFIFNDKFYTVRYPHDLDWYELPNIDYKKEKIRSSDLISAVGESLIYEYDFGDSWNHEILIEKILPVDISVKYPVCLEGKRNGPPEDCGGVWGYHDLLEILKHPEHEEYDSYIEWLGGKFDPGKFNIERVNSVFQRLRLF